MDENVRRKIVLLYHQRKPRPVHRAGLSGNQWRINLIRPLMLWHVIGTKLHILGSIHASDTPLLLDGIFATPLDAAEVLAFEANFDVTPDARLGQYRKGTSLSETISQALFTDTQNLWSQLNLADHELEGTRPWWAALRLMNALMPLRGFYHAEGVDRKILQRGKQQGKSLFFLEPVNAGLEPFARAPASEQELFLSKVVQQTEEGVRDLATIVGAWKSRRPEDLMPIVDRSLLLLPKMYSAALAGRNKAWLLQLLRLARGGKNVVAVVGALHMVGPGSIPSLLGSEGYNCAYIGA